MSLGKCATVWHTIYCTMQHALGISHFHRTYDAVSNKSSQPEVDGDIQAISIDATTRAVDSWDASDTELFKNLLGVSNQAGCGDAED